MHLYIVTNTKLKIPTAILDATIMDILDACKLNAAVQIVLVGESFSNTLKTFCEGNAQISFESIAEASVTISEKGQVSVLHFGTNMQWAKNQQLYFLPLLIPQEITNLSFWRHALLKKQFNKWFTNATKIICTNDWARINLLKAHAQFNDKIQKVDFKVKTPAPLPWSQLSAAQAQLSNGNNYFLFFAPFDRFVAILKEFSIFKKWQQTTMNLVVVLKNQQEVDKALVLLMGYKFKQDIVIYSAEEMQLDWLAASYATLWEGVTATNAIWIEKSIQHEIPLLFDVQINLPENWLGAGEVVSFKEQQVLSNHFKLYYKDEIYRQSRARMGKEWLELLNHAKAPQELFNNIVFSHIK